KFRMNFLSIKDIHYNGYYVEMNIFPHRIFHGKVLINHIPYIMNVYDVQEIYPQNNTHICYKLCTRLPKRITKSISLLNHHVITINKSNVRSNSSIVFNLPFSSSLMFFSISVRVYIDKKIQGGTIKSSDNLPNDGYLIDLSPSSDNNSLEYNYEFVTLRDLLLDSNFRDGGIRVVNSLRTSIDHCYMTHFTTNGILVQGGHKTCIRNSFLGQHITACGDTMERYFSGTAINLIGNDNAVTDLSIFLAEIGIMISGEANTVSGVHCYNKATGYGSTGIYLKMPSGLTQTRIVNSYLDDTGIVVEDPVQVNISSGFFLEDAVNIVDNMFSGSNKGIDHVQLDRENGDFTKIDQVVIDRNNVKGMNLKGTVARRSVQGNGSSWLVDLNSKLLFSNLIKQQH
ncbi:Hypothetical predicted protein, partial [Olea europaea subsp. europaea]